MTPPLDPESTTSQKPHRWRSRLIRMGIPVTLIAAGGIGAGIWYGNKFIHEQLAPLVAQTLTTMLQRPVNVGKLDRFSLTGLRFGASGIPATAKYPDHATVEAVEVAFNPMQLLFTRKLDLDIVLVKPNAYLVQDPETLWVTTTITEPAEEGPITINLNQLKLQDATVALLPLAKPGKSRQPVNLTDLQGDLTLREKNRLFIYNVAGKSVKEGTFQIKGESRSQKGLFSNLQVQGQNFSLVEVDRLVRLPVDLPTGRTNGNLNIQLRPNQPPVIKGAATFKDVTLQVPKLPQKFTNAVGALQMNDQLMTLDNTKTKLGKIPILAKGTLDLKRGFNLTAKVPEVTAAEFLQTFALQSPFALVGAATADVKVTGGVNTPILSGTVNSTQAARLDRLDIKQFRTDFRLATDTLVLAINNLQASPTAGGQVTGTGQLNLTAPVNVALNLQVQDLPGDGLATLYNDGTTLPIKVGNVNAQLALAGRLDNLQTQVNWQAPQATYPATGELLLANGNTILRNVVAQVAGGTVKAEGRTVGDRWQGTANLAQVQLAQFAPELQGVLSGNVQLGGSVQSFRPADIRANGQVLFSQGISLIDRPMTAQFAWDGQKVNVIQATAPDFNATGAVFAQLEGEGAPQITGLDLAVRTTDLNLQKLPLGLPEVAQLTGRSDFSGQISGTPTAPQLAGAVTVKDLVLNGIAFEPVLPGQLNFATQQGVEVRLQGQRDRVALTLNGAYRPQSLDAQLGDATVIGTARGDLFQLAVKQLPLAGAVIPGVPIAALGGIDGKLDGDFTVNLNNYAITDGRVTVSHPRLGNLAGAQAQSRFAYQNNVLKLLESQINLCSQEVLRRNQCDSVYALAGTLDLRSSPQFDGKATVTQGKIEDILRTLRIFKLGDIGTALQPTRPPEGKASDLPPTVPAGLPDQTLMAQLLRFSEINALLKQTRRERRELIIPELADVRGTLNGTISLSASQATGIKAEFDVRGKDLEWRPFPAYAEVRGGKVTQNDNRVLTVAEMVATGTVDKGVVNLLPLELRTGDSLLRLTLNFGGEELSGQLRIENFPVEEIGNLYPLPLGISGKLNATASLSGTRTKPSMTGFLNLKEGLFNATPVQSATGSLNYISGRLGVSSRLVLASIEQPLTVEGSIPIPFLWFAPADGTDLSLKVRVKDDGLALLNLITPQLSWQGGQGDVQLDIGGKLAWSPFLVPTLEPQANGVITLNNAKIQAQAFRDTLTGEDTLSGITGKILFDTDRLRIDQPLQGQFSRGQIVAQGSLPIFKQLSEDDPNYATTALAVSLQRIALKIKGLYQGGVDGDVTIRGAALSPRVGGEVRLTDGQVLLDAAATGGQPGAAGGTGTVDSQALEFKNLKLVLGDRLRVTYAPIINFLARGNLLVNGTLDNLQPDGEIRLTAGQVNLFTTQFVLARGYAQTAKFTPEQGLDPILDISLLASVPEVSRNRVPTAISSSEIADDSRLATNFGALQTIRIQAKATGPASQLFDNLDLTSSPSRSQGEILALLGGGFVNTLGRGDSTLGIANLAGSALLTNIQGLLGNAVGLSELRLFPTVSTNRNTGSSTLGLAAEVGVDLTKNISASALKVLTSDQPTQFGLRYRVNDQLLLRGSSDFAGDSRAVLEYELRF
jgi:translocation and assembly module TamB